MFSVAQIARVQATRAFHSSAIACAVQKGTVKWFNVAKYV